MKTVIIEGADIALSAGAWARDNILNEWDIDIDSMLGDNPRYVFKFANAHEATHFALKWV